MINQTINRVSENQQHDLARRFPGKGKPTVKVGDSVEASDIIAHSEISAGQRLIKVAHALGVGAKSVNKYLIRKVGDRIYQGEMIARYTNLFGLSKREVKSPADGVIYNIDPNGDVIIKFLPTLVRVTAGAGGVIKEVDEDSVTISTVATEVKVPIASGKERDGTLRTIVSPDEFLLPQHIDSSAAGQILVGGALLERATIEKALTIGVHGIVVGGINYRDFLSLGINSDVGLTVLVTGGFGSFPMGEDIYGKLKSLEGRFAFISGERGSLVIPEMSSKVSKGKEPARVGWKKLEKGDSVRLLHEKKEKRLGVVVEIKEDSPLASGIHAEVATIQLADGKKLDVAAANLDIIVS